MTARQVMLLTGSDVETFLQGLITNDIGGLDGDPDGNLVYAALLTPQGKYIADFFLKRHDGGVLLDVADDLAEMLTKRLTMYKLRADVTLTDSGLQVQRGTGPAPQGALPDPRHPDLGWRAYSAAPEADDGSDWAAIRVAHLIPQTGVELTPDTFILEAGFEALHGVDFRKGCYVGQEVTARMKHKTELRKGLRRIALTAPVPVGTEITADGKTVGTVLSQSGGQAIAYVRLDRATDTMVAGPASVSLI